MSSSILPDAAEAEDQACLPLAHLHLQMGTLNPSHHNVAAVQQAQQSLKGLVILHPSIEGDGGKGVKAVSS